MKMSSEKILLIIILFFSSVLLYNSPGCGDVQHWLNWVRAVNEYGIIKGYAVDLDVYPPLGSLFVNISSWISTSIGLSVFEGIKLSMYFYLFLTLIIIYLVTKNYYLTIISYFLLVINSIGLVYLDIYFTPFLILSLYFLKKKNILLTTIFFSIASMIKMQVIILMPFFVLQIFNINSMGGLKHIDYKKIILNCILPYSLIFLTILYIYGTHFLLAFKGAYNENLLSGDAANAGWIVTYFLHYLFPAKFGALEANRHMIRYITGDNVFLHLFKYIFIASYAFLFLKYFKLKEKTFEKFLLYATAAFLSYFMLNKGVHENHLHVAVILLILLYAEDKKYLTDMLIWGIIFNINLVIFFGFRGHNVISHRVIGHLDITLLFSILSVVIYAAFIFKYILKRNEQLTQDKMLHEGSEI